MFMLGNFTETSAFDVESLRIESVWKLPLLALNALETRTERATGLIWLARPANPS